MLWMTLLAASVGCVRTEPAADRRAAAPAPAPASSVAEDAPAFVFTEITDEAGLGFMHDPGVDGGYRMAEIMGPGCATADFDGDERLDLYLVNGRRRAGDGIAAARDRLYRQTAGGGFIDVTEESGILPTGYGMGCTLGDYDNDGDPDLYLSNFDGDELWRNNGDGTFTDVTNTAGLGNELWSVAAAFFDYDRDGLLDLFVVNYILDADAGSCFDSAGRPDYCGPEHLPPAPDRLYHNEGGGRFRDASSSSGIGAVAGPGLGVACLDLDDDGWQDVYVANDMARNYLWRNRHDGTFEETAIVAGCAFNGDGATEASMGIALGDADRDGLLDLFLTHLRGETNTLYRQATPGGFTDATNVSGLAVSATGLTGFGTAFVDVDHDGDLDLLVVNGAVKRLSWRSPAAATDAYWSDYAEPNLLYRNEGNGRFVDVSAAGGPLCTRAEVSRGLAVGDLDRDGDLDLLVAHDGGPARLFRNDTPKSGRWLIVRAVDPELNRDALGAVVTVSAGSMTHRRVILSTVGYASGSDPVAHFGLGGVDRIDEVRVLWPDGLAERFDDVPLDSFVELRRGGRIAMGTP